MKYHNIVKGTFLDRPNRFIAQVEIQGKCETVHVKNTGRCKELLVPDAVVYLEKSTNTKRSTEYDLVAVEKGNRLVNIDSQAPNRAVKEWLLKGGFFADLRQKNGYCPRHRGGGRRAIWPGRFDEIIEHLF